MKKLVAGIAVVTMSFGIAGFGTGANLADDSLLLAGRTDVGRIRYCQQGALREPT